MPRGGMFDLLERLHENYELGNVYDNIKERIVFLEDLDKLRIIR